MCIKIIKSETSFEFDPNQPLECQLVDAKEVVVDFHPEDKEQIENFVDQVEQIVKNGIGWPVDIKVNPNNTLKGLRLERLMKVMTQDLHLNAAIKNLVKMHCTADRKLSELSGLCLERTDGN